MIINYITCPIIHYSHFTENKPVNQTTILQRVHKATALHLSVMNADLSILLVINQYVLENLLN